MTDRSDEFERWVEIVTATHRHFRYTPNEPAWTPMRRPVAESRVALVTTTGAHLVDQPPYDVLNDAGDPTFRLIPDTTPVSDLRFSHTHYDTQGVEADPNVALPLDRLHELVAGKVVGSASAMHLGFMGFNPDPANMRATGAEAAKVLRGHEVDVALITPG